MAVVAIPSDFCKATRDESLVIPLLHSYFF